MFKLITPEVAFVGMTLFVLFVFGILILWFNMDRPDPEKNKDSLDTAALLVFPQQRVALAHSKILE